MTKPDKVEKNIEDFEKNFVNFLENVDKLTSTADELLKEGCSVSYRDSKGRLISEHPNGKKFLLNYNKNTHEITEGDEVKD